MHQIEILDTTLRDGAQHGGITFSVADKIAIVTLLDVLGIPLIEAGNPGSNPKDAAFFSAMQKQKLEQANLVAFGSTMRKGAVASQDIGLRSLLEAGTTYCAIFGKSSLLQVEQVLETTPEENLRMITESCRYLTGCGRKVIFDAEHFYDGYRMDADYALETLQAAIAGGAACLVLCDTNGGTFPDEVSTVTKRIREWLPRHLQLGVHFHNDCGLAVANTLLGVQAGATHAQGTYLGFGERCGNTNLSTLIPNLQIKQRYHCIPPEKLLLLTASAVKMASIANITLPSGEPYVGSNAFRHKAGMHADGVWKVPCSFEHVDPEAVGNQRVFPMSEMSGRTAIFQKMQKICPGIQKDTAALAEILQTVKTLEQQGYQFEDAEASFELLVRRKLKQYRPFFELMNYHILSGKPSEPELGASAMIKVRVGNQVQFMAAEGNGPVHALDIALRRALEVFYPDLKKTHLVDYKVRVLDGRAATAAKVRVVITSTDGECIFATTGVSGNVVEASWVALSESVEYALLQWELKQ